MENKKMHTTKKLKSNVIVIVKSNTHVIYFLRKPYKNVSKLLLYLINHDVKQEQKKTTACVVDYKTLRYYIFINCPK